VTLSLVTHSIVYVPETDRIVLTKRRAVDFCHVATAICCRADFQPAA
jgi:hypothetical protein